MNQLTSIQNFHNSHRRWVLQGISYNGSRQLRSVLFFSAAKQTFDALWVFGGSHQYKKKINVPESGCPPIFTAQKHNRSPYSSQRLGYYVWQAWIPSPHSPTHFPSFDWFLEDRWGEKGDGKNESQAAEITGSSRAQRKPTVPRGLDRDVMDPCTWTTDMKMKRILTSYDLWLDPCARANA